jgi:hypothetical protein
MGFSSARSFDPIMNVPAGIRTIAPGDTVAGWVELADGIGSGVCATVDEAETAGEAGTATGMTEEFDAAGGLPTTAVAYGLPGLLHPLADPLDAGAASGGCGVGVAEQP